MYDEYELLNSNAYDKWRTNALNNSWTIDHDWMNIEYENEYE